MQATTLQVISLQYELIGLDARNVNEFHISSALWGSEISSKRSYLLDHLRI